MMENYKKKLKHQNVLLALFAALLIAVQVLAFAEIIRPIASDSHWVSYWNGMIAGMSAAFTVLSIIGIVMNLRALRSEKALKKQFAKENDERLIEVARRGQAGGVRIFLFAMLAAVIVSGYFNVTVSLTCLVCLFLLSVTIGICKLYWAKKM